MRSDTGIPRKRLTANRGIVAAVSAWAAVLMLFATHVSVSADIAPVSTPKPLDPYAAEVTKPFIDRLQRLAGSVSRACGVIPIGEGAEKALACARHAADAGDIFWVAIQVQGTDSLLFRGAAREPNGTTWLVTFDSDVHGGVGPSADPVVYNTNTPRISEASLESFPCNELRFSVENEARIWCKLKGQP